MTNAFRDGLDVFKGTRFEGKKAEEVAKMKDVYPHYKIQELKECPQNRTAVALGLCIGCDHTDIVGYCCYPVDIQKEITEGRARPFMHEFNDPKMLAEYNRVANERAFRAVDKR
jgi:hypothetical protein